MEELMDGKMQMNGFLKHLGGSSEVGQDFKGGGEEKETQK